MQHTAPLSLRNSQVAQHLIVIWSSNEAKTISHQRLRGACPCAKCRAARIQGKITLVDADVKLIAMNSMGYGLQLVFSDGHDRGIYPWSYLRELSFEN